MRKFRASQGVLKILGEHPALDLVNSIDSDRGRPVDFWSDPLAFAGWAAAAGLAAPEEARRAAGDDAAFGDALALRRLLRAALEGDAGSGEPLAALLNRLLPRPLVAADKTGLSLGTPPGAAPGRAILARLALHAADLLLAVPRERIRQCRAPDCDWFFIDHSGGRRVWCLMRGCGNVAKARRRRAREAPAATGH